MDGYEAETYGELTADTYDEAHRGLTSPGAVELLAELAGDGPALELGIGTGRIALPLAATGVRVDGVDASPAMVAKLRAKPGGDAVAVTMGDFAGVPVEGRYRLIFVVFNTFFALLSQDEQVRCFAGVAEHLTDDGVFLTEVFVPDIAGFDRNQRVTTRATAIDRLSVDAARLDPVRQTVESTHAIISEAGIKLLPVVLRYAWPAELDLMARLAGLRLRERWSGWNREPFGPDSRSHVSVYGR